jgi:signal transduction histidine kinase
MSWCSDLRAGGHGADVALILRGAVSRRRASGRSVLRGDVPLLDRRYSRDDHDHSGGDIGVRLLVEGALALVGLCVGQLLRLHSGNVPGFAVLFGVGDANEYHMFYLLFLPIIWVGIREGYAGVAVALLAIQLGLVATTTYLGCDTKDFSVYQTLMLVLSITGLLLGAVITERAQAAQLLREQQTELSHVSAYAVASAMGTALAHEISQPLSTVASYLHAARRLLQSGAASAPVMDALSKDYRRTALRAYLPTTLIGTTPLTSPASRNLCSGPGDPT